MLPPLLRAFSDAPLARPSRRRRSALAALPISVCALLSACGDRGPAYLDLADVAGYQAGQVSTDRIAPDTLAEGTIAHGWVVGAPDEGAPEMLMQRERGRLWFYSADGATTGLELHAGLTRSRRQRTRRLLCRVNGEKQGWAIIQPEVTSHRFEFAEGSVRTGWNYLQLSLRHLRDARDRARLVARGVRFFAGERPLLTHPRRRIEVSDGELWMPTDSLLEAVFEVPAGARFDGRVSAEDERDDESRVEVALTITDGTDAESELARLTIPAGESISIDEALDPWRGTEVRLRIRVTGVGATGARWRRARIVAPDAPPSRPFDDLIAPAPVTPRGSLDRPDVVVILLDAARADAFSPWGGPRPTPALERLAAEGTVFERALSPSSWTGQAVPATLTGFFPETVGVSHWADGLAPDAPTLAELLADAGYHTALWSQHPVYSRGRSLARGFAKKLHVGKEDLSRVPTVDELFVDDRPTFAWIHLLPPHTPYTPPAPFRGAFSSWYDESAERPVRPMRNGFPNKKKPSLLSRDDRRYIVDRYHEHVAFADSLVGEILARLERAGRYDDTLVTVISDHGEAFLEHGEFLHASGLNIEMLHVPFVVKWPAAVDGFERRVTQSVSMVDLAPTLVAGLGVEAAAGGFQGRDLLPAIFDGASSKRPLYAITRGDGDPTRPPKRWIRLERGGRIGIWNQLDDRMRLYDLENDPAERRDLAPERPIEALRLRQELLMQYHFNRHLLSLETSGSDELDPELVEELKALGYL